LGRMGWPLSNTHVSETLFTLDQPTRSTKIYIFSENFEFLKIVQKNFEIEFCIWNLFGFIATPSKRPATPLKVTIYNFSCVM
jgi:hypothetical protein